MSTSVPSYGFSSLVYWSACPSVDLLFRNALVGKKVYLFSFLTHAACWVSNFGLKKFEKVEPISTPSESDVDINTKKSKSNSGSNETMKNILALSIGHHCC